MLNKLFMDIAKCGEITGHANAVGHRDMVPLIATDKNRKGREIIVDRMVDMNPDAVPDKINKIYDAFYSRSNEAKWSEKILCFEYKTNIDWYILLSYLFMVNTDGDDKIRMLRTAVDAAAVLDDINVDEIKNEPGYKTFLEQIAMQDQFLKDAKDLIN